MLTTAGTILRMATEDLSSDGDEARLAGYPGYIQRGLEMRTEAAAVFAAWCCTERMGEALGERGGGEFSSSLSRSLIDEWHLAAALRDIFTGSGLKPGKADYAVSLVKLLTAERDWHRGLEPGTADSFLRRLLHQEEIQRFLEINRYNGILWFSKDRFEDLLWWFFCIAAVNLEEAGDGEADSRLTELFGIVHRWLELEERSGYRVADLTALLDGVQLDGARKG